MTRTHAPQRAFMTGFTMRRLRTPALFAAVLVLAVAVAATSSRPALAVGSQIRTFVASTGSDANPCSRTAPCRTFGAALAQTAGGGEIVALDSGGYGAVVISQSVTIVAAPGIQASISPSSGTAITVSAGPSDVVVLRNLYLNAQGGNNGVLYQSAAALHVENLVINGFTDNGIWMDLATASDLYVADTIVRNTGGSGIYLSSASGIAKVSIVRARLENNAYGVVAAALTSANVKDTIAAGNNLWGFGASSASGSLLNLEGCVASGNGTGIYAQGGAVLVSNCSVTMNFLGIGPDTNSQVLSRGNNTVEANTYNGNFTGSYAAK
jgi:hypothetical protein